MAEKTVLSTFFFNAGWTEEWGERWCFFRVIFSSSQVIHWNYGEILWEMLWSCYKETLRALRRWLFKPQNAKVDVDLKGHIIAISYWVTILKGDFVLELHDTGDLKVLCSNLSWNWSSIFHISECSSTALYHRGNSIWNRSGMWNFSYLSLQLLVHSNHELE